MIKNISEKGSLKDTPVMRLLFALFEQGITGAIYIKNIDLLKVLYFDRGKLIWGNSNSDEDKIENVLVTKNLVQAEAVAEVKKEAGEKASIGKLLLEKGLVTVEVLIDTYKDQVKQIMRGILRWADGSYQLSNEQPPRGIFNLDLSIIAFIMEYIAQEVDMLEIWDEMESLEVEMVKTADQAKVEKYHLSENQLQVLSSFDGNTSLESILSRYSGGQREASLKLIYFFFMADLLVKKEKEETSGPPLFEGEDEFEVFRTGADKADEPEDLKLEDIDESVETALNENAESDESGSYEDSGPVKVALDEIPGVMDTAFDQPVERGEPESPPPPGPGPAEFDIDDIGEVPQASPEEIPLAVEPTTYESAEPEPVEIPPASTEIPEAVDALPDEPVEPVEPGPIESDEPLEALSTAGELGYGDGLEDARKEEVETAVPFDDIKPMRQPMKGKRRRGKQPGKKEKSKLSSKMLIYFFIIVVIAGAVYFLLPILTGEGSGEKPEDIVLKKPQEKTTVKVKEKKPALPKQVDAKKEERGKSEGKDDKITVKPKPKTVIPKRTQKKKERRIDRTGLSGREAALRYFNAGDFIAAGSEWKKEITQTGVRYSILLELDCQKDSVINAYRQIRRKDNFFILNRKRGQRNCYLVLWGTFSDREEANAALKSVPEYFWQQSAPPTVVDLKIYL